jgi:Ca-activated chloride channel family protein
MNPTAILHAFHFLRPEWLAALPLLWGLALWLARRRSRDGDWSRFIDPQLLPALRLENAGSAGMRPWPWLALMWSVAVMAMAGPSWQQDRTAAYRTPAAWVFVLDVSPSMATTDIAPDRVTRARYALDDMLGAAHDARVGLVAFSDEPYTVTPLTQDAETVRALLSPLAPDIMPSPGDHLAPALEQAAKLLQQSGAKDRRIVLLTDGFDDPVASFSAATLLRSHGVNLSVIGVGTPSGAPLRNAKGRFESDTHGKMAIAALDVGKLRQLATIGGGRYVNIAELPSLIAYLQTSPQAPTDAVAAQGIEIARWRDAGVWLLPLLLFSAALLARRDWI